MEALESNTAATDTFEPNIVAFCCEYCAYPAADTAGCKKISYPPNIKIIGVPCSGRVDVVHILKKLRQPIQDCVVELSAERAETEPKVFTKMHVHFIVYGDELKEDKVARAVGLSAEKYCSASIMFSQVAEVTHDFEIRPAATE